MEKIYLISGLGADHRLFSHIRLNGYEPVYVHWIEPDSKDTLTTYATKLIRQYEIPDGAIVIGVSLGGILTIEIAKQIKLKKAILISSIKNSTERPWYFAISKVLPIHKVLPFGVVPRLWPLVRPMFGRLTLGNDALLGSMLRNSSPRFLKWAMDAVLHFKNTTAIPNVYHLVGDKDLVFDHKRIKGADVIHGGTHQMVLDRADDVNAWLTNVLKK